MAPTSNRIPFLTWKPITYRASAGMFAATPRGWIPHVTMSNGSPWEYFNNLRSPDRKFSHGWIAKNGSGEQYCELNFKSWAQAAGNPFYWSFEFEGFDTEPYTQAQLITAARIHEFLGVVNKITDIAGDPGIGTHRMGGAAYGGHSCPGDIRANQRADILRIVAGDAAPKPQPKPSPAPTPPYPPLPYVMHRGSVGSGVVTLQKRLSWRGWRLAIDGVFGPATEAIVESFQKEKGLKVDGIVGINTWRALWTMPTANGKV